MTGGGVSAPTISNPTNFQPTGFSTGSGTSASFAGNNINFQNPNTWASIAKLKKNLFAESTAFGGLLDTVRPGFSQFRQAGLQQIENARQKNISNLSDSLAQRRVLGSSFANASISDANADFAQKSADFIAQSYLQELSASTQLTQLKFDATTKAFQTAIQQYNLDTAVGAQLSTTATTTLASVAETQAQLQLQASEFSAQLKAAEMAAIGQGIGSIFGSVAGGGMGGI